MLQVIATSTGVQPIVAGKPEPPIHAEAVARTGARRPLVVGDRLDTDIEGAVRGDADSMLVLTGVSTPAELVLAPPSQRPTYVSSDLRGLLEPQPAVGVRRGSDPVEIGNAVECQGWTARRDTPDGQIELTGDGEAIDGLRALCALAWSGPQITAEQADTALKMLEKIALLRLRLRQRENIRPQVVARPAWRPTRPSRLGVPAATLIMLIRGIMPAGRNRK